MITDKTLDVVDRWMGSFVCLLFPGLLILDCVFGKGLFGEVPADIFSFLLFVVYAAAISFAYIYLAQAEMESHFDSDFLKKAESDRIGTMTAPLVSALALLTVALNEVVEVCGRFNPIILPHRQTEAVNVLIAFVMTVLVSRYCSNLYYGWYRKTFGLPAPTPKQS